MAFFQGKELNNYVYLIERYDDSKKNRDMKVIIIIMTLNLFWQKNFTMAMALFKKINYN